MSFATLSGEYGDIPYLKIDIALGASKTGAIEYYKNILNMINKHISEFGIATIITKYIQHIPFHVYIPTFASKNKLRKDKKIHMLYEVENSDRPEYDGCFSLIQENCGGYCVEEKDAIEYINRLDKLQLIYNKELLIYFFSKYANKFNVKNIDYDNSLSNIIFGKYYIITLKKFAYGISIFPSKNDGLFNDKFDISVKKIPLNKISDEIYFENPIFTDNFINNMYYTVNFQQECTFGDRGIEFLHPFFRDFIKKNFTDFYNSNPDSKYIDIDNGTLTIVHLNSTGAVKDSSMKIATPPELDNYLIFVDMINFMVVNEKNTIKLIISLIFNSSAVQ